MKMDVRYANHPTEARRFTTDEARENFLIEKVFVPGEVSLTYSHVDRVIVGGIVPTTRSLTLEAGKELGAEYFLERRELGFINIGGPGTLMADGKEYHVKPKEGMYVGMETEEIVFASDDAKVPAKFYIASTPAHKKYPTVHIPSDKTNPVPLGEGKTCNKRTIYQYIHPVVCSSCQLSMGMTVLEEGSVWNTMPTHTHDRRMEVYLYFDMPEDARVFHLWGEPSETRHIVMKGEQAVISPSWSIHSGAGTSNYTFIWAMAGENQTFTDMDHVSMDDLR